MLIWLSVPLAAYQFASYSYREYQQAEQQQLRVLDDWESYLRVHTGSLTAKSREITRVMVVSDRPEWRSQWQALLDAREAEQATLPRGRATHYPLSQQKLMELDGQLDELQKLIERSELYWFDSLRLRASIEQLVSQIDAARANVRYYESIRAYGIREMLLGDLQLMEEAYDQRWNDLRRAEQQSSSHLSDAKRLSRQIRSDLDGMDELQREDSQESYVADLERRILEFNLPEELRKLAAGDDAEATPGRAGIV